MNHQEQEFWLVGEQPGFPDSVNPCAKLYGPGPDGAKCKGCAVLFSHGASRRYYKCRLRNFTHGPGSDHRANWPACGRFVSLPLPTQTPGRT